MQLEHCPFCGTSHTLLPDSSGRYQRIVCGACGACGPEVYRFLPYAVAVESWNTRQGPAAVNETHRPGGVLPPGVSPTPEPSAAYVTTCGTPDHCRFIQRCARVPHAQAQRCDTVPPGVAAVDHQVKPPSDADGRTPAR